MKYLIYSAAFVAALCTVLSTRLLIPALILLFKSIERGFAPTEPVIQGDGTLVDGPWWYHELKAGTSAAELIASVEADAEPMPVTIEEAPKPAKKSTAAKAKTSTRTTRKRPARSKTSAIPQVRDAEVSELISTDKASGSLSQ